MKGHCISSEDTLNQSMMGEVSSNDLGKVTSWSEIPRQKGGRGDPRLGAGLWAERESRGKRVNVILAVLQTIFGGGEGPWNVGKGKELE